MPRESITAIVIVATFLSMLLWERLRPLRKRVEPKARRVVRNLAAGGIALAVSTLLQALILVPLSRWSRVGLLHRLDLGDVASVVLAFLLLDYTLWFWHFACHRVAFLWRFHLVHHVDRDLDASTALRFHFGELALSTFYRALQIVVIGASPFAVWLWHTVLFGSILFHHANVRLPVALERWVVRLFVTPRMHGIHHSDQFSETDSNWSSLLSWWDYLHGTMVLAVPQSEVRIGVPAYQNERDVTLPRILLLPFLRQRRDFHRPDGTLQTRMHERPATTLEE